jgi:hypothetical protein
MNEAHIFACVFLENPIVFSVEMKKYQQFNKEA